MWKSAFSLWTPGIINGNTGSGVLALWLGRCSFGGYFREDRAHAFLYFCVGLQLLVEIEECHFNGYSLFGECRKQKAAVEAVCLAYAATHQHAPHGSAAAKLLVLI